MVAKPKQRPEALAQFAETARTEKRQERPGLTADKATTPIPTNSKAKDEAATKVLWEGATGEDTGVEAAIDKLPDRILDSRGAATNAEMQRLRNEQLTEGEEDIDFEDEEVDSGEEDIEVTLEEDNELADSGVIEEQQAGRMISPDQSDDDEAEDYGKSR